MKTFAIAAISALASAASEWPSVDVTQFKEDVFKNKIDHFNYLDDRTYD